MSLKHHFFVALAGLVLVLAGGAAETDHARLVQEIGPEALVSGAWKTQIALVQVEKRGTDGDIPQACWAEPIRRLNPLRVYLHRVNVVVVTKEDKQGEMGLYICIPISSFIPREGDDGFRYTQVLARDIQEFRRDRTASGRGQPADAVPPWQTNRPIVTVTKELYRRHTQPRQAALVSVAYVGPRLERREVQGEEAKSDVGDNVRARWSMDNGRTWTEFVPVQPSNNTDYRGVTVWEGEGPSVFDSHAEALVQSWLRQIVVGKLYHCFTYSRYSQDLGRTWSAPQQLRYETGAAFDPNEPKKADFLDHNEGYFGNNLLVRRDGTIVHVLAHCNALGDPRNQLRPWRMGSVLFQGRWNPTRKDYDWTAGARVEISPEHSARGLMEPEVAELADGRLLVVWRGSTHGWDGSVARLPGRKFFSLSTDDGRTLTAPAVWRYDDGTDFYSPSSYHRMIRHSVSGKLYWLGNISATPPSGNSPRYPLVVGEVDEVKAALKKQTVTAIDDRRTGQPAEIQFSNFSLLEDRETHQLELHLTTYGQEPDPADWATADNYKYFLKFP